MKEEERLKAVQKYEQLIKEKTDLQNKKSELKKLSNNETVKKFLQLIEECDHQVLDDKQIISISFRDINLDEEKKNIYVYIGAYNYDYSYDSRSDYVANNIEKADYLLYKNIENEYDYQNIPLARVKEFESKNIILKAYQNYSNEKFYLDIREYYLKLLLKRNYDNDKEVAKILKKKAKEYIVKTSK